MWEAKREFVTLEEIEIHTTILLEEWHTPEDIKRIIVRIVGSHAFMIPANETRMDARKFDHEEFRNYFLARALAELFDQCTTNGTYEKLRRFLYIERLPDSVAMYCFNYIPNLKSKVQGILNALNEMIANEWKPTYLQLNIGTLLPFMIDKIEFESPITFDAKVNYSSLIFENKTIRNITFKNGNFINISLRNTILENVHFINCNFSEIKIETQSSLAFKNVCFKSNTVNSIILLKDGDVLEVAYSPTRISELLNKNGIKITDTELNRETKVAKQDSEFKKSLVRFILKFNKMTIQYLKNMENERYFGPQTDIIINEVIPFLEDYKIIEIIDTKKSRQANSKAWRLSIDVEELFKYDGVNEKNKYLTFWEEVNSK